MHRQCGYIYIYVCVCVCLRKIPKSDYLLRHVSLTVRMELDSHWTYFQETGYLRVFQKPAEKIQVSLTLSLLMSL
jgi:hypothetical protein